METKGGLLRIGISTGIRTKGVQKEAVMIAKSILAQMGSEQIVEQWDKYYLPQDQNEIGDWDYPSHRHAKWGVVLSVGVPDLKYALSIMKSFEYDEVFMLGSEEKNGTDRYHRRYNKYYHKQHIVGDDYTRNKEVH
tara:strand:- start:111 stop:518 length:408 start_codon:yes stop_codon:yes gene_type:complete